ncbi:MAG: hypothetical protein K2H75_02045 [Muribaculaceae bacterium]|nr:hypothetical protein [Muribaculaceae bacterium]
MGDFPEALKRQLIPNGQRRVPWHDYYGRSIYMITLNAAQGIPHFSSLKGIPGNRDWPPCTVLTPLGEIIAKSLSSIKANFPFTKIMRRVIMPEHVHFVLYITEKTKYHLGDIISWLKGACTRAYAGLESVRKDRFDVELQSVFEAGYHDRLLLKDGQLNRMLRYVSDNPRRRLERMNNPGFHIRCGLSDREGNQYEAYGNIQLLEDHDIEAVKISRSYSPEHLRKLKINWLRTVQNCGVLISPFISIAEKRIRNWAINNGGRLIYIIPTGFGPRFSPKGMLHDLCSEGRLLLIAPREYKTSASPISKRVCNIMNQLAVDISEGRFSKSYR